MSDEKITVWITRYALTEGVIEATASAEEVSGRTTFYALVPFGDISCRQEGLDWHRTKDRAIARAESMRVLKLASLRRHVEKIEAMRFE